MGLSSKQVSGDWDQTPPDPEATEQSKKLSSRRQPLLQQETEALECPRCESKNTKFCYYNNYNKSQPRHFCKSCKRHWTKGGTLRNVPVGGGRKNKRPKISNSTDVPTTNDQLTNHNAEFHLINYNNGITNASVPLENIPNTEFPFSSVGNSFELLNASSLINPVSYELSLNEYGNILDSMEESTITTVNFPGPSTMELTNSWNWNEIDVLTSVDHLWDEDDDVAGVKP